MSNNNTASQVEASFSSLEAIAPNTSGMQEIAPGLLVNSSGYRVSTKGKVVPKNPKVYLLEIDFSGATYNRESQGSAMAQVSVPIGNKMVTLSVKLEIKGFRFGGDYPADYEAPGLKRGKKAASSQTITLPPGF